MRNLGVSRIKQKNMFRAHRDNPDSPRYIDTRYRAPSFFNRYIDMLTGRHLRRAFTEIGRKAVEKKTSYIERWVTQRGPKWDVMDTITRLAQIVLNS